MSKMQEWHYDIISEQGSGFNYMQLKVCFHYETVYANAI